MSASVVIVPIPVSAVVGLALWIFLIFRNPPAITSGVSESSRGAVRSAAWLPFTQVAGVTGPGGCCEKQGREWSDGWEFCDEGPALRSWERRQRHGGAGW